MTGERHTSSPQGVEQQLVDLHEQLLLRDDGFRFWEQEIAHRDQTIARQSTELREVHAYVQGLLAEIDELKRFVAEVEQQRAWRLARRWRGLKQRARTLRV